MSQSTPKRRNKPWFGLIRQGESSVAPTGLALVAVLIAAVSAAGYWAWHTQRQALANSRAQEIRAAGDLLASTSETLIQARELSALRRLVIQTATQYQLERCRIVMNDGMVLADSDPAGITQTSLPETWLGTIDAVPTYNQTANQFEATYPLYVANRSAAKLEVMGGPRLTDDGWTTQAGIGGIGVVSLVLLLLVYRYMRNQARPLTAISESLRAVAAGETHTEALTISPRFGFIAESWNQLLDEREGKRVQGIEEDARAVVTARHNPGGELADACNALSQGLLLIDEQMRLVYANGAAAVFLGRKRDELINSQANAIDLAEPVTQAIATAIQGPVRQRRTLEINRDNGDGESVLRFAVRPVTKGEAPAAVLIIDDITQQRVAEHSRNSFIAQATHELRMPLTNIRLYVETALESGDDDPKLRGQCLNVINSESRRLETLVSDMLNISEIEAGSMSLELGDVRLDALFEQLENDFKAKAQEKSIDLQFNLPPKLPVIQADRERLCVPLQNLVGNALKYTPNGGKVDIAVEATNNMLNIDVKDSGIGIKPADAEHVFDKFFRAEDKRVREITGTGLGLALAREVARLHGGDITVDSQIDRGTTFSMTLPINAEAV